MNVLILGAAGFIGTNLAIQLSKYNSVTVIDRKKEYFSKAFNLPNVTIKASEFFEYPEFSFLKNQDILFHLLSTNNPTTSNNCIYQDIQDNVLFTCKLLDACVEYGIRKIVFISSGGTVYGKDADCPIIETTPTNPISSYGIQKLTIEKLLYLYNYLYGIDYRIVRLANPYGPYQRPNGILGAVTTFIYKALKEEEITVYGDGSVVRDFIYIDDAIRAIQNITEGESTYKLFNVGSGYGTSIKEVLNTIEKSLGLQLKIVYTNGRTVDVPENYLDIRRYENCYGKLNPVSLETGIRLTAEFLKKELL